jgi:hypoxanthine phosphoribosyltransferase
MLININEDSNLLIIDDIFDSGKTIKGIVDKIKSESKNPKIKIATVYYKPKNNKTDIVPDFYLKKTGSWLVFPHELEDLTEDEIKKKSKKEHKVLFR